MPNHLQLFSVHGNRRFVQLGKLESEHFMDRNGEFQLEFNLSNIKSIFEEKFKINQSIFNNVAKVELISCFHKFWNYESTIFPRNLICFVSLLRLELLLRSKPTKNAYVNGFF